MAISKSVLGMNARNFIYIRKYNPGSAKQLADDKIRTKELLMQHKVPTTELITIFPDRDMIRNFNWDLPNNGFVVKPARGYGGEGILVFKNWDKKKGKTLDGKAFDAKQLESHFFDILEGAFSLQYLPDVAYIEELVKPATFFKKISPFGLPDIRVIVFNKVPVMAMLRVPTKQSEGKANLHKGAIGLGIDLRTGITTHAISKNDQIEYIPDTNIRTGGLQIPKWDEILLLAAKTQEVSKLGYAGVDIVLDEDKGPLVLEINSRPGLSIQNANNASLRTRLERLEHMDISTIQRGVEIAKSLFAEPQVLVIDKTPTILSVIETVVIENGKDNKVYEAKVDTGAFRTSMDENLAKELGLKLLEKKILITSANGKQLRSAVRLNYQIGGKSISTIATVTDRKHLFYPIIIGRRDLKGFLVNPMTTREKEGKLNGEID